MATLLVVHNAYEASPGTFVATVDLEWQDGSVDTCPYVFDEAGVAPICVELWEMYQLGEIDIVPAPVDPVEEVSREKPDVIT